MEIVGSQKSLAVENEIENDLAEPTQSNANKK